MTGHARDPEITRYRPHVRLTRSQSGMSSTQEQAEWAVRVARGMAQSLTVTVLDWRAGADRVLWKPNQLAAVYDPYSGTDKDMLIVEGAVHGFTPCTACEKTPGQYANATRNMFDYIAKWINARY